MADQFLYEELDTLSKYGELKVHIPEFLPENLNPRLRLRPYQKEAFCRFVYYHDKHVKNKVGPLHLLFNMATGSGKTLIMAGLILYLYERGYSDFLFLSIRQILSRRQGTIFLIPPA